jgi:hypothetical protein
MRRSLPILAFIVAGAPAVAQACSCAPESIHSLFARLRVVFEGTVEGGPTEVPVESARVEAARNAYRFKVHRVWKGNVGPAFTVAYPKPTGANCGVELKHGVTMLVGAYAARERLGERGRPVEGNSCTMFNMNQPTLDYARELGPPQLEHRH